MIDQGWEMDSGKVMTSDKVEIEYYTNEIANNKTPVIVSMGNWEPAFRGFPILDAVTDRLCVVLSYRGRGKSSAPERGYDWKDHAKDIRAVVEKSEIKRAIFVSFSKGVSYSLSYIREKPEIASGLILVDYPAIHCLSQEGYAGYWYNLKYMNYEIKEYIQRKALEGIERESTYMDFFPLIHDLKCPIMLFVGRKEDAPIRSNLEKADIEKYLESNNEVRIVEFMNSGHMIFDDEPQKAIDTILRFIKEND